MHGFPANTKPSAARPPRGFTLVELLVVLLIIAALVLIAVPRYFHAIYTSRVRGCQAQITIINTAAQVFFSRNRVWPTSLEEMSAPTAPPWVISPPLQEVPLCPFGTPYQLAPVLQDGTVGDPSPANPQVGVAVLTDDHFQGSWKTATQHVR